MSKQGQKIVPKFIPTDTGFKLSVFQRSDGQGLLLLPEDSPAEVRANTDGALRRIKSGETPIPSPSLGLRQKMAEKEERRLRWMLQQD